MLKELFPKVYGSLLDYFLSCQQGLVGAQIGIPELPASIRLKV